MTARAGVSLSRNIPLAGGHGAKVTAVTGVSRGLGKFFTKKCDKSQFFTLFNTYHSRMRSYTAQTDQLELHRSSPRGTGKSLFQ